MCQVVPPGVQGLISQELPTWAKDHKEKSEKEERKKKDAKIKEVIS